MNEVTHRYTVSLKMLEHLEHYCSEHNPTIDELLAYFRKLKLTYRHGLAIVER